ncbi:hypothetical protein DFH28DRAFT_933251 [Melampsora americana]|nr:hypothetical protein DFH28DRAFT_933251 [Melampsora americana]
MTRSKKKSTPTNSPKSHDQSNTTTLPSKPEPSDNQQSNSQSTFNIPPKPSPPDNCNNVYFKVETLDDKLRAIILQHDAEQNVQEMTTLQMYRILVHFNPATKSRPHHKKSLLTSDLLANVFPLIRPYVLPAPATQPMQTDQSIDHDFDPLSRKITKNQLTAAIRTANPKFTIAPGSRTDSLLLLYKVFVDKDLLIPPLPDYIKPPRSVSPSKIGGLHMEELRMTLQYHCPHVFIYSGPMSLPVLTNLYLKFVCEENVPDDVLVRGYHYALFINTWLLRASSLAPDISKV